MSTRPEAPRLSTIYLVRHGETILNAGGVLRGHLDPPLNPAGRLEAEALARALGHVGPTLIVSSPLERARETARFIASECRVPVEVENRLMDRDYGPFAGHPQEEVEEQYGSLEMAPEVEASAMVLARAAATMDEVAGRLDGRVGIVIAHEAINRVLLSSFDPARFPSPDKVPQRTACYNVVHRLGRQWIVGSVDRHPRSEPGGLGEEPAVRPEPR
jgi:broad specificity phosphatase PhoE